MVEVTDRLVELLGLETLREKQETAKRLAVAENEVAKNEALVEAISALR